MPTYKRSAVTAKEGINFIRYTVEMSGSLFIKIEQESDLGIDALIEFVENERPLSKQIAVQIKSGASYYTEESGECAFRIGNHREYWSQHPLPLCGLVYIPALQRAHWVNIKKYLKSNPSANSIRFTATEANRFDRKSFKSLFMRSVLGQTPAIRAEEAFQLARSNKTDEMYLGLLVLFRRYPNNIATWDELVRAFVERPEYQIPPVLLYWLAHVPWHGDIFGVGEPITPATREYARGRLSEFSVPHVIKLLSLIDPDERIARGSLGQSIEAIISIIPEARTMLREIIRLQEVDIQLREYAALMLAMYEGSNALQELSVLASEGSWYAGEISMHIKEYGYVNPYM